MCRYVELQYIKTREKTAKCSRAQWCHPDNTVSVFVLYIYNSINQEIHYGGYTCNKVAVDLSGWILQHQKICCQCAELVPWLQHYAVQNSLIVCHVRGGHSYVAMKIRSCVLIIYQHSYTCRTSTINVSMVLGLHRLLKRSPVLTDENSMLNSK